jgi:S-formylglutathione hydrolase FrmB
MRREGKLVAALVAAWFGLAGAAQANDAEIVAVEEASDRVLELTIETPAFTEPTKVHVYLPPGYREDRSRDWPVTYFTAGTMNNYNTLFHLGGEELTAEYDSILVSPDGNSGYWSDWYNGGLFGPPAYETFVIDQLIPLIDARYRTKADRAHRLVTGVSMGGYGAAMFAARHPDLFSAVASLSGATDSNLPYLAAAVSASSTFDGGEADAIYGPRATQEIRWRGHNPTDLASNLRDVDVQVRTANGIPAPEIGENPLSADGASCVVEQGVYQGSMSFHSALTAIGKEHVYQDYGNGCHTMPNFMRQTVDTLKHFETLLADPPPAPETFDHRAIEPAFDLWGWRIEADPARALEFLRAAGSQHDLELTGSGTTTVSRAYPGLARVDVDGVATPVPADGRVTASVDLGPPNETQQYTAGAGDPATVTKAVAFAPHAVVRIGRVTRTKRGLRVCARVLGGEVRRARIAIGGRSRVVALGARKRCRTVPGARRGTVRISGRDGFGHRVRSSKRKREARLTR